MPLRAVLSPRERTPVSGWMEAHVLPVLPSWASFFQVFGFSVPEGGTLGVFCCVRGPSEGFGALSGRWGDPRGRIVLASEQWKWVQRCTMKRRRRGRRRRRRRERLCVSPVQSLPGACLQWKGMVKYLSSRKKERWKTVEVAPSHSSFVPLGSEAGGQSWVVGMGPGALVLCAQAA